MRLGSLVVFLALTSCATTPISVEQASTVPGARILAKQMLAPAPYTASLVIKRDSGFMGSACSIRVFVDGVAVADLETAEKVEVFVSLGEHIVAVTSNGICGGGTAEAAVVVVPERQRILRIASGQSGDLFLQPTAF
jgi:hypothetical protein